jgi:hypothetical protein
MVKPHTKSRMQRLKPKLKVSRDLSTLIRSINHKLLCKFLMAGIALGYAFLGYYYYKQYLSEYYFISATITVVLSVPALLLLKKSHLVMKEDCRGEA